MTHQNDYSLREHTLEELTQQGLEAVPESVRVLLNKIMQIERSKYLQAGEWVGRRLRLARPLSLH
jgi:putative transposase